MGSGMYIWALRCIYGLWDAYMGSGMRIWALGCVYGLWDAYMGSGMHIWSQDDHGRTLVSTGCGEAGHQPYNCLNKGKMPIVKIVQILQNHQTGTLLLLAITTGGLPPQSL